MNWYIGQRVVALKTADRTTPYGAGIIKNDVYTIAEIYKCPCQTIHLRFSELPNTGKPSGTCSVCRIYSFTSGNYFGGPSKYFAPIEENFAEQALNKAIEQAEEILEIIKTVQPVDNSHTK